MINRLHKINFKPETENCVKIERWHGFVLLYKNVNDKEQISKSHNEIQKYFTVFAWPIFWALDILKFAQSDVEWLKRKYYQKSEDYKALAARLDESEWKSKVTHFKHKEYVKCIEPKCDITFF